MKLLQILLAEDNRGDVLLVRQALQEHHIEHELHVVGDGAQAIDLVERMGQQGSAPCPDVLLLDLNLPKKDGAEVLAAFREHPECCRVPVIVVTSSDAPRDKARMSALGADAYFRKPSSFFEFMKLGSIIREVLERNAAGL